jgi:NAD(P)-dependent dehydrogenase (short-subunit alcohol dehydrogenase family)
MPVYCITGTNRGLGLEFVKQLVQSSTNTIIATTHPRATDLSDLHAIASPSTHILKCDVSSISSIHAFIQEAQRTLGNRKIDFLLNNAGVNLAAQQDSLALGPDELHAQLAVNVLGPAKMVELLLGAGLLSDNVRILNMSSGLGSMQFSSGLRPRSCAGYSISKAALNMLTVHQSEDVRRELPGAVVILMAPGLVKTRMGGEEALLEPSESVSGMLRVLDGLGRDDTGSFYQYTGKKMPW